MGQDDGRRKAVNVTGPHGAFVKGPRLDYDDDYDYPRPIRHGAYAQIQHMRKYAQIVRCVSSNYAAFEKKQKQKKKPNRRHSKKKKNVKHQREAVLDWPKLY